MTVSPEAVSLAAAIKATADRLHTHVKFEDAKRIHRHGDRAMELGLRSIATRLYDANHHGNWQVAEVQIDLWTAALDILSADAEQVAA